jgi:lipid-A-disaccharide synthase-like uncharacterized protein
MVADPPQEACSGNFGGLARDPEKWEPVFGKDHAPLKEIHMLIDIARSVGGYLHDVFLGNNDFGIMIGYVAQIMFAMRFVVQWIASERAGRSVVPTAFWVFSIGGGIMLLGYAIYRKDPVFIVGQAFGVFVYLRNLQFVIRSGGSGAAAA